MDICWLNPKQDIFLPWPISILWKDWRQSTVSHVCYGYNLERNEVLFFLTLTHGGRNAQWCAELLVLCDPTFIVKGSLKGLSHLIQVVPKYFKDAA